MPADTFASVTLARILRPWGRRGEVAAEILTDYPDRLLKLREVWLSDGRQPPRRIAVRACRGHLGQILFHFEGIDSISAAESLRGLEVQVPLSERAPAGPGRYYIDTLIGCMVWDASTGHPLGTVRNVQQISEEKATAESWVLEVAAQEGELLIPLAAEICRAIDTSERRIEVQLPEGLRELNRE